MYFWGKYPASTHRLGQIRQFSCFQGKNGPKYCIIRENRLRNGNHSQTGAGFLRFRTKNLGTFWGKCTEQSSRKKLAVGGFEPEKVRLLYPAPLKASLLSTTIKVRFLQYFIQNERKSSKIRVIQGLGVVNWTAPRPFFRFQSRKIAKNAGWGCAR